MIVTLFVDLSRSLEKFSALLDFELANSSIIELMTETENSEDYPAAGHQLLKRLFAKK